MYSEKAWLANGKSDVPCLFDSKCAFLSELCSLPLHLEQSIKDNKINENDIFMRRYKALLIPIE